MAHAQKPDFVFLRNGRVHLNRQGRQFSRLLAGVRIRVSNTGYTMFRGSVKSTGYPLRSPVSPSLPLPCVTVCHHISTGLYPSTNITFILHHCALGVSSHQLLPICKKHCNFQVMRHETWRHEGKSVSKSLEHWALLVNRRVRVISAT